MSDRISGIMTLVEQMTEQRKKANALKDTRAKAIAYCDEVKPLFDRIGHHSDKLELMVDDELWPLPKMRETHVHPIRRPFQYVQHLLFGDVGH